MEDIELKKVSKRVAPFTVRWVNFPVLSGSITLCSFIDGKACALWMVLIEHKACSAESHRRGSPTQQSKTRKTRRRITLLETGVRILFIHTAIMLRVAQRTYTALLYA